MPVPEVPVCADCGTSAPRTQTAHTLISASFGWRLTVEHQPGGGDVKAWRCPACWKIYRAKTKGPTSGTSSVHPPGRLPR